jgi:hypothetical protein
MFWREIVFIEFCTDAYCIIIIFINSVMDVSRMVLIIVLIIPLTSYSTIDIKSILSHQSADARNNTHLISGYTYQ